MTAVAIRTAIVPPATTEYNRFFREGVTPASAISGFAIAAARPVVTATGSWYCLCWLLLRRRTNGQDTVGPGSDVSVLGHTRSQMYLAITVLLTRQTVLLCAGRTVKCT